MKESLCLFGRRLRLFQISLLGLIAVAGCSKTPAVSPSTSGNTVEAVLATVKPNHRTFKQAKSRPSK